MPQEPVTDLTQTIIEVAGQAQTTTVDGTTTTAANLRDLIAANQYLAANKAAKTKNRGLRISRIVAPGAP